MAACRSRRQPDGKIVVACSLSVGVALARYTVNGVLDPTFGVNGITNVNVLGATGLAIQSDGKILLAGLENGELAAFVERFTTTGALDLTFGTAGTVLESVAPGFTGFNTVVVLPDGRIEEAAGRVFLQRG